MRRKKKKYGSNKKEICGKSRRNHGKNKIKSRKYCKRRDLGKEMITVSTMIVQERENMKIEVLIMLRKSKETNKKEKILMEKKN